MQQDVREAAVLRAAHVRAHVPRRPVHQVLLFHLFAAYAPARDMRVLLLLLLLCCACCCSAEELAHREAEAAEEFLHADVELPGDADRAPVPHCDQACGAKRRWCIHTCKARCHPNTPCPTQMCKEKVTIPCACGRLVAETLCMMGSSEHPAAVVPLLFRARCGSRRALLRALCSPFQHVVHV